MQRPKHIPWYSCSLRVIRPSLGILPVTIHGYLQEKLKKEGTLTSTHSGNCQAEFIFPPKHLHSQRRALLKHFKSCTRIVHLKEAPKTFSRSDDATIALSSIRDVNKDICASAKCGVVDEDAAAAVGGLAKGGKRRRKLRLYPCLGYTTRLMRVIICADAMDSEVAV
jgi:hypothetical protein